MFRSLNKALVAIPLVEKRWLTPRRVQLSGKIACQILKMANSSFDGTTSIDAYDELGYGLSCVGIPGTENGDNIYILVAEKEVYPPRFWIGEC